jgi:hypothetical protein
MGSPQLKQAYYAHCVKCSRIQSEVLRHGRRTPIVMHRWMVAPGMLPGMLVGLRHFNAGGGGAGSGGGGSGGGGGASTRGEKSQAASASGRGSGGEGRRSWLSVAGGVFGGPAEAAGTPELSWERRQLALMQTPASPLMAPPLLEASSPAVHGGRGGGCKGPGVGLWGWATPIEEHGGGLDDLAHGHNNDRDFGSPRMLLLRGAEVEEEDAGQYGPGEMLVAG